MRTNTKLLVIGLLAVCSCYVSIGFCGLRGKFRQGTQQISRRLDFSIWGTGWNEACARGSK